MSQVNGITRTPLDINTDMEHAHQLVEQHNLKTHNFKHVKYNESFYVVGLTGKDQVRYTLYRYTCVDGVPKGDYFIRNLNDSLLKSIENVTKHCQLPILIDNHLSAGRKRVAPSCFPKGKYAGQRIADVFESDESYVKWYVNNVNSKTKHDRDLKEEGKVLIAAKNELTTQHNLETSNSQHIGTLKHRDQFTVKITQIQKFYDRECDHTTIRVFCEDQHENIVFFYFNKFTDQFAEGETITLKGTIVAHQEYLGIKQTRINRVALPK